VGRKITTQSVNQSILVILVHIQTVFPHSDCFPFQIRSQSSFSQITVSSQHSPGGIFIECCWRLWMLSCLWYY